MSLGKINFIIFLIFSITFLKLGAEDKIISAPIINLENLEPSYESLENENDVFSKPSAKIKQRKIINEKNGIVKFVNLMGLDKITAKTFPIKIKLGETAKFGLLEIKALKCGISNSLGVKNNSVAYLQVKDISENQNEKVFIFNGWTFSSNPSLASIDHAIYDVWLVSCENA